MDVLDNKTDKEIAQSILAETAKAKNEIASAESDIRKAKSRLGFLIVLANELINRKKGSIDETERTSSKTTTG